MEPTFATVYRYEMTENKNEKQSILKAFVGSLKRHDKMNT